jgi:beta-glucanase (GH16 family)
MIRCSPLAKSSFVIAMWCVVAGPLVNRGLAFALAEVGKFSSTPRWGDEFNGTSIDTSKWFVDNGVDNWQGIRTPEAVQVGPDGQGNNCLTLRTWSAYDQGVLKHYDGAIDDKALHGSADPGGKPYGYYEARVKWKESPGMWSSFWLMPYRYTGTPIDNPAVAGTEMDIVEHYVYNPPYDYFDTVKANLIWNPYSSPEYQIRQRMVYGPGINNDGQWHTHGVAWDANGCRFYMDDQLILSSSEAISQRYEGPCLAVYVGNAFGGTVPTGGYGAKGASSNPTMIVDYVHVYAAAPEPSSILLLGIGTVSLLCYAWRKKKQPRMSDS